MIAASEVVRTAAEKDYRSERSVKSRLPEDRFTPSQVDRKPEPRSIEKTTRRTSTGERLDANNDKPPVKTRLKAEPVRSETREPKKDRQRETTNTTQKSRTAEKIQRDAGSKPESEKAKMNTPERKATKTSVSGTAKAPAQKTGEKQPAKRRR